MTLAPLPTAPKRGKYRHYKGGEYMVLEIGRHSETLEPVVVYQALYGDGEIWVRPLEMFVGDVELDGRRTARFEFLGDA
jgi:cyclomaltodextrinase / maltogenic alpha-amylase / neopullulanase